MRIQLFGNSEQLLLMVKEYLVLHYNLYMIIALGYRLLMKELAEQGLCFCRYNYCDFFYYSGFNTNWSSFEQLCPEFPLRMSEKKTVS